MLGIGFMMSITAQAQGRDNDQWQRRNGGYNNGNQMALTQGYQAGIQTGASDAQRGQSYSPQRSRYYRDASSQAFRNGFVQGYDAGFRQYGGYNNNNGGYRTGNTGIGIGDILGAILSRP
jgi:hypothetical protein